MITDEQARAAAAVWRDKAMIATKRERSQAADVLEKFARQELSRRTPPDDGPITAEWCTANGFRKVTPIRYSIDVGNADEVQVLFDGDKAATSVNGRRVGLTCEGWGWRPFTRSQLLALLAALRCEPCGQTGQLPQPSSPAEQLHLRGQQNNI